MAWEGKFSGPNPAMDELCEVCGHPYGSHSVYHCPEKTPTKTPPPPGFGAFISKYGNHSGRYLRHKFGLFYLTEGFLAEFDLQSNPSPYVQGKLRLIRETNTTVMEELSDFFQKYTFMALVGESRHAHHGIHAGQRTGLGVANKVRGNNRRGAWATAWSMYHTHRLPKKAQLLRHMISVFEDKRWSMSYGGAAWANIGKNMLSFWVGDINEKIFVDTAVTLAHNGGPYLDKLVGGEGVRWIRLLFDAKRHAPTVYDLYRSVRQRAREGHEIWKDLYTAVFSEYGDFITYLKSKEE